MCDTYHHEVYDVISWTSTKFGAFWYMSHPMSHMTSYGDDIIFGFPTKNGSVSYRSHYVTNVTKFPVSLFVTLGYIIDLFMKYTDISNSASCCSAFAVMCRVHHNVLLGILVGTSWCPYSMGWCAGGIHVYAIRAQYSISCAHHPSV
jgi:hypothetical protein